MQYVKECLRLLYWMYFKPYTLKRHVQNICPEITDPYRDNIYSRSAEAKADPRLQRYDEQSWWLTALVPIAAVFLYAPLAEGVARLLSSSLHFNWWLSSFFLTGWLLGQIIIRAIRRKLTEKTAWLVIIAAIVLLLSHGSLIKSLVADPFIRKAALGVAFGVVSGVAFSLVFGMAFGMAFGIVAGAAVGLVTGVVPGVAFSLVFGMVVGVVAGVAFSLAANVALTFGMVSGVTFMSVVAVAFGLITVGFSVVFSLSFLLGVLRLWFWLPELLWMLLLKLAPVPASRRLCFFSTQLDQIIYLPLPFLPGFIAEAYQENQAAARQTIDYLITSTNQQKTAAKATAIIAAEECSRCQTARDIVAIRNQLNWIPNKKSDGLTTCLEISQDVAAALEASSLYRQAQQQDKVIQKIERQRNALSAASAREATSFGSVLDSWQRILETARRTLREQAARSDEIPQVYLAGPALDPNKAGTLFKGRRDLFRQIETLTLSAQHPTLVMYGGRRCGKTSALNYLPKWMPSDILPLLIDGQSLATTSTLSGFAEDFAEQLIRSARKVHRLKLPALDSEKLARDPFAALFRWIDAVEDTLSDKTLLICLDEFERLDEIVQATGSRAPLNFLRHLIQHRDRWTLLFTGAHTPEELPAYWSDYLINSQTLRVSYLAEEDAVDLIRSPIEGFPDIYSPDAVAAIWRLTGGQPYFIQLLCHELVEELNRRKEKSVSNVEAVLPVVFERGDQVFREFWSVLSEAQQGLLRALSEEREPSEEERRAAALLVRKEILAQEGDGWVFRVPLICHWVVMTVEKTSLMR